MLSPSLKNTIAGLIVILLWSSAYIGIRFGLNGYSPGAMALLRYSCASVVIALFYYFLPNRNPVSLKDLPWLMLMGFFGIGFYNILLNYGEITVSPGIASFIVGLVPMFIIIFATFFLKEKSTLMTWVGIAISMAGLGLILESGNNEHHAYLGIVFTLLATLSCAIFNIFQKRLLSRFQPIELVAFSIWFGTLPLLFFLPQLLNQISHAPYITTADVVYMGVFPGAIAYIAWGSVLSKASASQTSRLFYTIPITTILLSWLLLNDVPNYKSIVGGLIALIGTIVIKRSGVKKEETPAIESPTTNQPQHQSN